MKYCKRNYILKQLEIACYELPDFLYAKFHKNEDLIYYIGLFVPDNKSLAAHANCMYRLDNPNMLVVYWKLIPATLVTHRIDNQYLDAMEWSAEHHHRGTIIRWFGNLYRRCTDEVRKEMFSYCRTLLRHTENKCVTFDNVGLITIDDHKIDLRNWTDEDVNLIQSLIGGRPAMNVYQGIYQYFFDARINLVYNTFNLNLD